MLNNPETTHAGTNGLPCVSSDVQFALFFTFILSIFVNILVLTGPLFMLQVYDRVLGSRSEETLVALAILVGILFLFMGVLDWARGRIMVRIGAAYLSRLDERVFDASLQRASIKDGTSHNTRALHDLETLQRFFGSSAMLAFFDALFAPLFALLIFTFHPVLGSVALIGAALLILITFANQLFARKSHARHQTGALEAKTLALEIHTYAIDSLGLGLQYSANKKWRELRGRVMIHGARTSDLTWLFSTVAKTLRMFLQSAMLGIGALLVLRDQMSAGAMIAASILLGRSLAPIEVILTNWPLVQHAALGWKNLRKLLRNTPEGAVRSHAERPKADLVVDGLSVVPPQHDNTALRDINFDLAAGQALGVIGPSGSGKTTLLRAITGAWPVSTGNITLGGMAIEKNCPIGLPGYIGYLPQSVLLFHGSLAENIARFAPEPDMSNVRKAAQLAGVHSFIQTLPDGYDTQVTRNLHLSGGQRQLVGLARALYQNPILLVLDEPNSNLDAVGAENLNIAIRSVKSWGGSVVVAAHRPAAICECDLLMVLDRGGQKSIGPRDEVLSTQVSNVSQIRPSLTPMARN